MNMPNFVLSPEVVRVLRKAGWREGHLRVAEVEKWRRTLSPAFELFPAARETLLRFGGIRVEQDGPGEQCARATFDLDPTLAVGEEDRFQSFEPMVSAKLYPLGEAGGGFVVLAIAEGGEIYAFAHDLWLVGTCIEEALERLVRGLDQQKLT